MRTCGVICNQGHAEEGRDKTEDKERRRSSYTFFKNQMTIVPLSYLTSCRFQFIFYKQKSSSCSMSTVAGFLGS